MLSHEEHRRLAAIERQLTIDDPALARRFARHRSAQGHARRVAVAVLGTIYDRRFPRSALGSRPAMVVGALWPSLNRTLTWPPLAATEITWLLVRM
jgi:hypothetical protein